MESGQRNGRDDYAPTTPAKILPSLACAPTCTCLNFLLVPDNYRISGRLYNYGSEAGNGQAGGKLNAKKSLNCGAGPNVRRRMVLSSA